jgi:transcription elongation factor Elf1
MGHQFSCGVCGSASIRAPQQIADDATIVCGGCGQPIGTWAELKEQAKRTILAHCSGFQDVGSIATADPLP